MAVVLVVCGASVLHDFASQKSHFRDKVFSADRGPDTRGPFATRGWGWGGWGGGACKRPHPWRCPPNPSEKIGRDRPRTCALLCSKEGARDEVPKAMRNRCPSTRGHLPAVVCGRTGGAGERGLASAPRARAILAVSRADSLVQSTNMGAPRVTGRGDILPKVLLTSYNSPNEKYCQSVFCREV